MDDQNKSDDETHFEMESESSSVHVGLGPYDVLMDEAKWFREAQELKKAKLDCKFKDFVDDSRCFPDETD